MNKINIVLSGEGGQGVQTIAEVFTKSAFETGLGVSYMPAFGVEQRGTPSMAFITLDDNELRNPQFNSANFIFILQKRSIEQVSKYIFSDTTLFFDSSTISRDELPPTSKHILGIPATKIANEKFHPKSFNVIILGVLGKRFNIPFEITWNNLLLKLGKKFKTESLKKESENALKYGYELTPEDKNFSDDTFKTRHRVIKFLGHNKSGELLPSSCKGCGICIVRCPVGAISFGEDLGVLATPLPKVDLEKCIACGNCTNFCPDGAINIVKNKV